jgi:sulfur relay (sulfurtransferase) complex TusBCD TusD component (DsrE family)
MTHKPSSKDEEDDFKCRFSKGIEEKKEPRNPEIFLYENTTGTKNNKQKKKQSEVNIIEPNGRRSLRIVHVHLCILKIGLFVYFWSALD